MSYPQEVPDRMLFVKSDFWHLQLPIDDQTELHMFLVFIILSNRNLFLLFVNLILLFLLFINLIHFDSTGYFVNVVNILKKIARIVLLKSMHPKDGEVERRKKLNKFKESAWKCIYYLSAEVLAIYVTYDEPWFTNTIYFWVGPGDQIWPDQKIK